MMDEHCAKDDDERDTAITQLVPQRTAMALTNFASIIFRELQICSSYCYYGVFLAYPILKCNVYCVLMFLILNKTFLSFHSFVF